MLHILPGCCYNHTDVSCLGDARRSASQGNDVPLGDGGANVLDGLYGKASSV